ncbi:lysozyme inhibitor LprI family protein [Photobacterium nomapromontoriensis]|uniref:lysozyme inhibitor LprI family protein n=1 Tax=Photobacterium nomapromontoriensis TaxID=2910237 RepID=UPI003D144F5C
MNYPWLLVVLAITPVFTSQAASFDCSKAASPAEKMICQDPILNTFDEILGEQYKALRSQLTPVQKQVLREEQLTWWEERDRQCSLGVSKCIPSYGQRIGELRYKIALESFKQALPHVTTMAQLINSPNYHEFLASRYSLFDNIFETDDYVKEMWATISMYHALQGTPGEFSVENGLIFGSACEPTHCEEKGFILVDINTLDAVFGIISFRDKLDRYFRDKPQLILFYNNDDFFEQNASMMIEKVKVTTQVEKVISVRAYDYNDPYSV